MWQAKVTVALRVIGGNQAASWLAVRIAGWLPSSVRVAFLLVSPLSFLGAAILFRARKFLDDDMQKIMMAVLTAMQEENERKAAEAEKGRFTCGNADLSE